MDDTYRLGYRWVVDAPIAPAAFSFNHDWAMARGQPGLRRIVRQSGAVAETTALPEAASTG